MWKPLGKDEVTHAAQSEARMKIQRERIAKRRNKYALASVVDNLLTRICTTFEAESITDLPLTLISDVNHLVTKYGAQVSKEHPTPFQQHLFDTLVLHQLTNREALKIVRAASASLEWSQSDASLCAMSTTSGDISSSNQRKGQKVHLGRSRKRMKDKRRNGRENSAGSGSIDIWSAEASDVGEESTSSPRKLTIEDLTGTDDGFRTEDEGVAIDIDNSETFLNSSPSAMNLLRKTSSLFIDLETTATTQSSNNHNGIRSSYDAETPSIPELGEVSPIKDDVTLASSIKSRPSSKSVKIREKFDDTNNSLANHPFFNHHSKEGGGSSSVRSTGKSSRATPQLRVHAGQYRPGWRSSFMPMAKSYVDHPPAPRSACVIFNHSQIDDIDDIHW